MTSFQPAAVSLVSRGGFRSGRRQYAAGDGLVRPLGVLASRARIPGPWVLSQ
jgi:hypothetical protein